MSESRASGKPRTHVLYLLRDGPTADALRWSEALAHSHEVELVDLTQPGIAYAELLQRILVSDRVISW